MPNLHALPFVLSSSNVYSFKDGNGRTARIYMNIALKTMLGLPFPVIITATAQQRREYVNGLKDCRSRLQQQSSSRNRDHPFFESLIAVVLDRVLHAVVQVNSLVETRMQAAAREEEARGARRVRERAAAGQCVICLDDGPNISTLCCGQALHMTCLAEWLSNQGSCIGCRNPMPRLIQRTQRQAENRIGNANNAPDAPANEEEETTTTDETTEDSDTMQETTETTEDNDDAQEETEETTDQDETTTTVDVDDNVQEETTATDQDEKTTTVDEDNQDVNESTTEEITSDNDTSEDTTDSHTSAAPRSVFCGHCQRNRYALDCSNELCGRCCQLYGEDSCTRHNC